MRVAHLLGDDGITAELWVGALVDAGASPAMLQDAIDRTGLPVALVAQRRDARSVRGTSVRFDIADHAPRVATAAALRDRIAGADLDARTDQRARAVIEALLRAEAAVHQVAVDDVHLHELGRAHTVARAVAGAVALEELGIDRVTVSRVAVGGGAVQIAHGRFPVPAPATLHLLAGVEVVGGPRELELTTPSGAAVLAAIAEPVAAIPTMRLERHGRGVHVGADDDARLLTVLVGEEAASPPR